MSDRKFVILCVDDEPVSLLVRSRVLEKAGHEVITASSGSDALKTLRSTSVDLVLTDLLMPTMTGIELTRNIKKEHPSLPVVMFSGVNELPQEEFHADLFLSKLEGPQILCEKIAEVLHRSEYARHQP